jgi:hypothetical protein
MMAGWGSAVMAVEVLNIPYYEISIPLIWKFTEVADAPPVIVFVVAKTCLTSIYADELAAIAVVAFIAVPASAIVNVCAEAEVFVTTIFVITVVVEEGVV